jgi:hypothetical protein
MTITFEDFKKKFSLETNKTIPQDFVELPSSGAKATIRPMKVKEQKEVLKALEKRDEFLINEALDAILSNCVVTVDGEPFDGDKLCIQDRTYVLMRIRQLTTGPKAKISHVSNKTGKVHENIEIELDKLLVEKYSGTNLNQTIDVADGFKLHLGPVTRKNEKDIEKYLKANKDNSLIDRRYAAYAAIIKAVSMKSEGSDVFEKLDLSFTQALEFVNKLTSQADLDKIDEYIKKELDFGLRLTFDFKDGDYENPKEELTLLSFFIM